MKAERIAELYKDCSALITEKTQEIHKVVLGYGNEDADILFLADMPNPDEEEHGQPLIGVAGLQISYFLEKLGLTKENIYTSYVMKYSPYRVNASGRISKRAPHKDEINFFVPYLKEELRILNPKLIVTLGDIPLRALMGDDRLKIKDEHGKARKTYITDRPYKVFPMYHPSYYKTEHLDALDADLEILKKLIDYMEGDPHTPVQREDDLKYVITPKKVEMKPEKTSLDLNDSKKNAKFKTIVIYGGEGYADDPTLVAVDRICHVLTELNTRIIRLDLHKKEYNIQDFFAQLKEAQAVIIATTVEWLGIGGYLQTFLDQCWKYGNKQYFNHVYLFGVVISKQGYERDTYHHLIKSWELLGGVEGSSICAHIAKSMDLETNHAFLNSIDKKTEEFYRLASQNRVILPTSIRSNKVIVEVPSGAEPTIATDAEPGSSGAAPVQPRGEARIASYDEFVEKQQKDIEDITNILKLKMSTPVQQAKTEIDVFMNKYKPSSEELTFKLQWSVNDKKSKNFVLDVKNNKLSAYFGNAIDHTVFLQSDSKVLEKVLEGKMTIQRAFMTGEIKARGDFTILYKLDTLFPA